jgi:hypothetical protein
VAAVETRNMDVNNAEPFENGVAIAHRSSI